MNLTDDLGRKVFQTIEITLVCAGCLKTDHPERCVPPRAAVDARIRKLV